MKHAEELRTVSGVSIASNTERFIKNSERKYECAYQLKTALFFAGNLQSIVSTPSNNQ